MTPLHFANFLAANMDDVYEAVAQVVGQQLKRPIRYTPSQSSDHFDAATMDVAFVCGLPYVQWHHQNPAPVALLAAPRLCGTRYQEQCVYFSDIIVRHDGDLREFADLAGKRWAFNEEISYSGYQVVAHFLRQQSLTWDYFGEVIRAGSHQNAIQLVQEGQAEAAAIDSQVLAVEMKQRPSLATELRVIGAIGPSPMPPVVAASRLEVGLRADIQQILLTLHHDPTLKEILAQGCIECFAEVDDAHYDAVRQVIA